MSGVNYKEHLVVMEGFEPTQPKATRLQRAYLSKECITIVTVTVDPSLANTPAAHIFVALCFVEAGEELNPAAL